MSETPTTPTPAPKAELSPVLKQWIGFAIALVLGFLASKYGITPQPTPPLPLPSVVVLGSQPGYAGQSCQCSTGCQCQSVTLSAAEAKRISHAARNLIYRLVRDRHPNADYADIDAAIDALTSDRPFLDWIRSGELLELIKAILEIIRVIKPM